MSILLSTAHRCAKLDRALNKYYLRSALSKSGCWFVDIPRTSSSSIRLDLAEKWGTVFEKNFNGLEESTEKRFFRRRMVAHLTAFEIRKIIGASLWNQIYTFTVVRNPYERFYSLYRYRQMIGDLDSKITYLDYVRLLRKPRLQLPDSPFCKRPYFLSQSDYISDTTGKFITSDWFKFENRRETLGKLSDRLGLKFSDVHTQKSENSRATNMIKTPHEPEVFAILSEFYSDDFENFMYPKDYAHDA